jgi:uncharacterized RDD family membrane protein YckC
MFEYEGSTLDPRVATFGIRAAARVIDTLFLILPGFVATVIALIVLVLRRQPGTPALWARHMGGLSLVGVAISFLGTAVYHALSEFVGGATVGKLVCGLRVVSEDFTPVSFRGTVVRSLAFVVDSFLFGLIGYRSMNASSLAQRYGDHWGKTIVVRIREFREASRGPVLVLLGLFMGLAACVILQVLFLVAKVVAAS